MRIKQSTILTAIYLLGVVFFLYFMISYSKFYKGDSGTCCSVYSTIGFLFLEGIIAMVGFIVAKEKGENPVKWAIYCFLLNIWALIFLHSLHPKKPEKKEVKPPITS